MSLHRTLSFALLLTAFFALTACDSPEDKLTRYLERGNELVKKEAYKKARLEYKNAARLAPTSAEVRYRLGLLDEATGDIRNAYANFVQAELQDKNHYPALLKLAQYYMASNQLEKAINKLDPVFSKNPNNPEAIAILAAIKLRQGDLKDAEKEAHRALSIEKKNITAIAVLTGLYQKSGETDKAIKTLKEGIKNNPKDESLLLLKTSFYKKIKNFSEVKEAYNALFQLKPTKIAHRLAFATELYNEKRFEETETFLHSTIKLFPKNIQAKNQLVIFMNAQRGLEPTEKLLKQFLKHDPNESQYYFWLADLYITHKDSDKAATLLQEIVEQETDIKSTLNARTSLAKINIVKGDRSLADKLISAVLKKEPSHQEALYIRANLAFKDGAYQKAISDLRTIIRDNPQAQNAYQLCAETLLIQGRIDLAIDTLAQLLDHKPDAGMAVRVRLAQMFEANNNPEQGLALLNTVTKFKPNYPYGWESTARLALTTNNLKLANKAIKKLEDISGYQLTAKFLKGKLYAKQKKNDKAVTIFKDIVLNAINQPIADHALKALSKNIETERLIEFLVSLETKPSYVYNYLGDSYKKINKLDLAAEAYDQSIAQAPAFASPYINRARLYLKANDYENAYSILQKAIKADPTDYIAPIMSAEILTHNKEYDAAIALYESILSRNSDVHAAANNMANLIANQFPDDQAKLQKARLAAERFVSSNNPLLLDTLAWVYYQSGRTQQALTVIQRATAIHKDLPPVIYYHYAKILLDTQNKEFAKKQLNRALKSNKSFTGQEDAIKLLKILN